MHGGVAPLYPLQLAVTAGDGEMVDLLVSHGAAINRQAPAGFASLGRRIVLMFDDAAHIGRSASSSPCCFANGNSL
jgi:hypothetical protein